VPRNPVEAGAVGRLHRERALERDLGNAVAVDVGHGLIHDLLRVRHDEVALPRRVLVPGELLHLQRVRDDVGLAVFVEVRDGHGIPASEVGVDIVRDEVHRAGGRRAAQRAGGQRDQSCGHHEAKHPCIHSAIISEVLRLSSG
jgi:hypothetical protein